MSASTPGTPTTSTSPSSVWDDRDCCAGGGLMALTDAWQYLQDHLTPAAAAETMGLSDALGRTLTETITARAPVPAFNNSAMDGYALAMNEGADNPYQVVGEALAGAPWEGTLARGQAIRIMTGAAVPRGANTVIMQEKVERKGDTLYLAASPKPDDNIRPEGDDFDIGDVLLRAGDTLGVAHLGLLAAAGVSDVNVLKPLRVALLATGDELRAPGEPLGPGQIYETNRPVIKALLRDLPVTITDFGILPDNPDTLRRTLTEASEQYDLVISTGGVSVGDSDYTRQILEELGDVHFWRLAIKPGKPLAFGKLGNAWFFGLPGNPVSALATAHVVMLPALRMLAGQPWQLPHTVTAVATATFHKRPGRRDFQRSVLTYRPDGSAEIRPTGAQGSHQLSVIAQSNAYAILAAESGDTEAGESILAMPFPQSLTGIAL